jgi:hypothetical protein
MMKLEYLAAGSPDCPIIRLYEFTSAEARQFHAAVSALASESVEQVVVHKLPFVGSVRDCRLTLVRRGWRQAIIYRAETGEFECGFTSAARDNVAGLVEPFAEGAAGFQWLAGVPVEAALLLSVSGEW